MIGKSSNLSNGLYNRNFSSEEGFALQVISSSTGKRLRFLQKHGHNTKQDDSSEFWTIVGSLMVIRNWKFWIVGN